MDISYNLIKNIFDTLPIGYYLGRRIKNVLSMDNIAYFDPFHDEIVVGAGLIHRALANIDSEDVNDVESLVRGILYHEISHVLLTPKNLKSIRSRYADQINIFEDERIETILKDFYLSVNFKKNAILINNFKGEEPKNAMEAFYYTVRFRKGKYANKVAEIIYKYRNINSASCSSYVCSSYVDEIINLYDLIAKDFATDPKEMFKNENFNSSDSSDSSKSEKSDEKSEKNEDEKKSSSSSKSDKLDEENEDKDSEGSSSKSDEENEDETEGSSNKSDETEEDSEGKSGKPEESESSSSDTGSVEMTDTEKAAEEEAEEINDSLSKSFEIPEEVIKSLIKEAISDIFNVYNDPQLLARLTNIINLKLKSNKKNGSAINSYSGKLDIRAVAKRDDYKWWAQQNRAGHVRQYSKVHFNLFIDNSGSFSGNDVKMNTFIQMLNKIKNPDFDFDVITINTRVEEWENTNREFDSYGGNCLEDSIATVIKKHTKNNTNNYNIVLFDGDAHSDDSHRWGDHTQDPFRNFGLTNTIIVTDDSNRKYIEPSVKNAKVIYTNNYCSQFIDEVCNLLERVI